MDESALIGMRVRDNSSHAMGVITAIRGGYVFIDFDGEERKYNFPAALATRLELEDENVQEEAAVLGSHDEFESFKNYFKSAIFAEIDYIKSTGGKKYRAIDGEKLETGKGEYSLYAFDVDTDLHFPEGTMIKILLHESTILGNVVACEDFTLLIRVAENLGDKVDSIEFTADQVQLLEALAERLNDMTVPCNPIAYEVACKGKNNVSDWPGIRTGQNYAFNRATSERVTFIWGPPGTGKTETLANIALEHMSQGKRVLMLSYSNVSVDGALLRVASKADLPAGRIIRYGYPRAKELLESQTLTSYQYVLSKNPQVAAEYQDLIVQKKKLKKKDPRRVEINRRIGRIRERIDQAEKELIQRTSFLATTISKAVVDRAVYYQKFDVVIFDEASMAYVPQIVYAAGMAKRHFVCLGDFRQLSSIVQNRTDMRLERDIFEHVGITKAVENKLCHEWLVMLNVQHRMHEDIANFVGENMYGGMLETSDRIMEGRREMADNAPIPGKAISLIDLSGTYSVCVKTMDGSRVNLLSALTCMRIAESYIDKYEVGIITPYSAQSRLILAMLRDAQEKDERWKKITCATVHQFQGSEKPIIIYDAVDCYRMPYPGVLLTAQRNSMADRLFNVAMTRAKGKFILIANADYLFKKGIPKDLLFTKALKNLIRYKDCLAEDEMIDAIFSDSESDLVAYDERFNNWERFVSDLRAAEKEIIIDLPGFVEEDDDALAELGSVLKERQVAGVEITVRMEEDMMPVDCLKEFVKVASYVTTPVTTIDKSIIWFGQPLSAAEFLAEGSWLETKAFPCARFKGEHATKSIQLQMQS